MTQVLENFGRKAQIYLTFARDDQGHLHLTFIKKLRLNRETLTFSPHSVTGWDKIKYGINLAGFSLIAAGLTGLTYLVFY